MTVLSNVIASALSDGTRLSQAEPLWVRVGGSDSTEFVRYGTALYQNGAGAISTHAVGTQDREISLEVIDSYDGGNSGNMKFFLAYGAASNIDGLHVFHDGTSWRLRRFISYLITISDAAFNQGNVRRKIVIRSESGNVTLSVYDASDSLIGSQTATNALDAYTGALPACVYDGGSWSVGDAVNRDGIGYISIKIDDLQSSGTTDYTPTLGGGGVIFGGSSAINSDYNFSMDGTLSFGGSADVLFQPASATDYTPTLGGGGIVFGGAAQVTVDYLPAVIGAGIQFGGGSDVMATWNFSMSGGLGLGGAADIQSSVMQPLGSIGIPNASDGTYADKVTVFVPAVENATEYRIFRNSVEVRGWSASRLYDDSTVTPDTVYSYTYEARNPAYTSATSSADTGYADSAAQQEHGHIRVASLRQVTLRPVTLQQV